MSSFFADVSIGWLAELYLYGGHLLLVSFWSSVVYAYVETKERSSNDSPSSDQLKGKDAVFVALPQEEAEEEGETAGESKEERTRLGESKEEDGTEEGEDSQGHHPQPQSSAVSPDGEDPVLSRLRWSYCVGYLLMMAGDWLQGPYMYDLYRHYGYSAADIGVLFVAGFASSAVFGSVVASLADVWGKKNFVLIYAVVYIGSCITKHSPDYNILMAGRIMGGIATSILFSAFESWVITVSKHEMERAPSVGRDSSKWLAVTFSYAGQVNSAVAIGAGLVGEAANMKGGPVVPFDLAIVCLTLGAVFVAFYWQNDYSYIRAQRQQQIHQQHEQVQSTKAPTNHPTSWWAVWRASLVQVLFSPTLLLVGLIQSCFEGSMYLFIFMWSPALVSVLPPSTPGVASVQSVWHGAVFAGFMICAWCGSYLFSYGIGHAKRSLEALGQMCMMAAAVSIAAIPFLSELYPRLVAFSAFELCVGMFWPYMSSMREKYILDENMRATCMTLYRIPLNCFVVVVLTNIQYLSETNLCVLTATGLGIASIANFLLITRWSTATV